MYMHCNDISGIMFVIFEQDVNFSTEFLACWEANHKMRCTNNSIKLGSLKGLVKKCGLSIGGKSLVKLRIMLNSL